MSNSGTVRARRKLQKRRKNLFILQFRIQEKYLLNAWEITVQHDNDADINWAILQVPQQQENIVCLMRRTIWVGRPLCCVCLSSVNGITAVTLLASVRNTYIKSGKEVNCRKTQLTNHAKRSSNLTKSGSGKRKYFDVTWCAGITLGRICEWKQRNLLVVCTRRAALRSPQCGAGRRRSNSTSGLSL